MQTMVNNTTLLVDGRNAMYRAAFAFPHLSHNGEPTGMLFGFMKNMITLWNRWPRSNIVIAWDSRPKRRIEESLKAIDEGIITKEQGEYKANRHQRDDDAMSVHETMKMQEPTLEELLSYTLASQVKVNDCEADDVIGSLSNDFASLGDVFIVSSDHDFYQLIDDHVSIFDPKLSEVWNKERFMNEFGIEPVRWIDVGALEGDKGDNIHGVHGCGVKTAIKLVSKYGGFREIIEELKKKEKKQKIEQRIVECEKLVHLAYSLKKIDRDVVSKDMIQSHRPDAVVLKQRFLDLGFQSLVGEVSILSRRSL